MALQLWTWLVRSGLGRGNGESCPVPNQQSWEHLRKPNVQFTPGQSPRFGTLYDFRSQILPQGVEKHVMFRIAPTARVWVLILWCWHNLQCRNGGRQILSWTHLHTFWSAPLSDPGTRTTANLRALPARIVHRASSARLEIAREHLSLF